MKSIAYEPWQPTPGQRAAAEVLADKTLYGARVKTRPDGIAVVRTLEKRQRRRYHIGQEGHVTLIEAKRCRGDAIGRVLLFGGVVSIVTGAALLILLQAADVRTSSQLEWLGWVLVPAFVAGFIGHCQLQPESDDDEWWVTIGAPRD